MFLQLLKKKSHELNFTKSRGSECRGNLKSRTAGKLQKSCNLLPQIGKKNENKCKRWKVQNRALLHFIGKNKGRKCFSKKLKVTGIKYRDK